MKARRFLNAVRDGFTGYSVGRIKIKNNLFYASTEEALQQQAMATAEAAKMKKDTEAATPELDKEDYDVVSLSRSKFQFKPSSRQSHTDLWFLPFYGVHGEGNFLCVDQSGHAVLYDADASTTEMMPRLPTPKRFVCHPISFSVTHGDAHDPTRPDALYVMDRPDGSFKALVYGDPNPPPESDRVRTHGDRYAWHWRQLPLPPGDHIDSSSYALLHGQDDAASSTIIVSFSGRESGYESSLSSGSGGTYCFDTASHEWTKAGGWMLPFWGRSHHAPELGEGLLFGLIEDEERTRFCAMDISGIKTNRAPVLRHAWMELADPPEDWSEETASVEYLGAGRFCIHRSFDIRAECGYGDWRSVDMVVLLTGVEVVRAPGSSRLRMVKHKTKSLDYGITSMLQ